MPSANDHLDVDYWMKGLKPDAVEIHGNLLTKEIVAAFHDAGVIVQAQSLGDRDCIDMWRACFEMGVDWIQTDFGENVLAEYLRFKIGGSRPVKISLHRGASGICPGKTPLERIENPWNWALIISKSTCIQPKMAVWCPFTILLWTGQQTVPARCGI